MVPGVGLKFVGNMMYGIRLRASVILNLAALVDYV